MANPLPGLGVFVGIDEKELECKNQVRICYKAPGIYEIRRFTRPNPYDRY